MKLPNWLVITTALLAGITFGLIYGWVIAPVEYVDVTPNLLREDYRADYVLMVAEAHQREQNSATSARRLALLGSESPAALVEDAMQYAALQKFTETEQLLLKGLLNAMQTYQPGGGNQP